MRRTRSSSRDKKAAEPDMQRSESQPIRRKTRSAQKMATEDSNEPFLQPGKVALPQSEMKNLSEQDQMPTEMVSRLPESVEKGPTERDYFTPKFLKIGNFFSELCKISKFLIF